MTHPPASHGILIANLGTPDAPTVSAVRRYLREFLSDPRVVDYPRWLWWLILNGVILQLRPWRTAHAYQKIWTEAGSPLRVASLSLVEKLQTRLAGQMTAPVKVVLGMRYGNPSIPAALAQLQAAQVKRLFILPLYPQYSATTTASVFDAVAAVLKTWRYIPVLQMINQYAEDVSYIDTIANSIQQFWEKTGAREHLLFSFHGLPKRFVTAGDPYQDLCLRTVELIVVKLKLPKEQWSIAFQSRFGREEWLQPYCDHVLRKMPRQGIKQVDVICPGFATDCLETLEEIALTNQKIFLGAGGEQFRYIPALNDQDIHVELLMKLVMQELQ